MAITNKTIHDNCQAVAVLVTDEGCPHYAKLWCTKHKKMIQWLNKADFEAVVKLTGKFENDKGKIFDKSQIKVKRDSATIRPPSKKPKDREIIFQRKDGHLWRDVY